MRYLLSRLCFVFFSGCFLSCTAWGQGFLKPIIRGTLERSTAPALQQQIERAVSASVMGSTVNESAYRSMLHMEPGFVLPLPAENRFPANAFLVKVKHKGKNEIWGVTTKELAMRYGKKVILRTKQKGKEIVLPAEVVQEGPKHLSDIALLKVPQELPEGVEALEIATEYNHTNPVSLYTFDKDNLLSFPALTLQKDNGYFMRMDFSNQRGTPHSVLSSTLGAPILSNGKAVGVFCRRNENGGYGSSLSILPFLVESAHQSYSSIPFKIKNYDFGEIDIDEEIQTVIALDQNGKFIGIECFTSEMHQSTILRFINNPKTAFLRFTIFKENGPNRFLFYDVKSNRHFSVVR